jgi:pimeloyl-ACP methyl ester carboxylesterase
MTAASDSSQLQDGWVQINVGGSSTDGARMHYLKVGNGPPLLLLHGLLGSAYTWRYNVEELSQLSTVYAIDQLGMGHSERVPGLDAGLEATAVRTIAFMDALHLDKADIVGTGHGGALALLLSARYPDRVGKLILAAPANPYAANTTGLLNFYRASLSKWLSPQEPLPQTMNPGSTLPHILDELAVGWMYGDPANVCTSTLENYMASLRIPFTPEHVLGIIKCWQQDMDTLSEALPNLRDKAMLLLWGDRDHSVELDSATTLQQHLPHAKLTVLRGAGHLSNEEMPDEFNQAVRQWLERRNRGNSAPASGSLRSTGDYKPGTLKPTNLNPAAAGSTLSHKHLTGPIFLRRFSGHKWA